MLGNIVSAASTNLVRPTASSRLQARLHPLSPHLRNHGALSRHTGSLSHQPSRHRLDTSTDPAHRATMASKKDMRRPDLIVPYQPPEKDESSTDFQSKAMLSHHGPAPLARVLLTFHPIGTMTSTLPMAAVSSHDYDGQALPTDTCCDVDLHKEQVKHSRPRSTGTLLTMFQALGMDRRPVFTPKLAH
ncbi:unnamed protein product [Cercospora beticola]|nr:unnamed protein product [Cercospora beticola]